MYKINKNKNTTNRNKNLGLNKFKNKSTISPKTQKIFGYFVKFFLVSILISSFLYVNYNTTNKISLLAVSGEEHKVGTIVDLELKTKKGIGNIFMNLDSIKEVDTQYSLLFAKQVACDLFNLNCRGYDYYFDFNSNSEILKGPSAGAGLSILVVNAILGKDFPDDIAITGTINPGGIVGVVDGINEKVDVAVKNGKTRVIIPYLGNYTNNRNDVEVFRVVDIFDIYKIINNEEFIIPENKIEINSYEESMKKIAQDMCDRTLLIRNNVNSYYDFIIKNDSIISNFINLTIGNSSVNNLSTLTNKNDDSINVNIDLSFYKSFNESFSRGITAIEEKQYYSAGSFCFNANINGNFLVLKNQLRINSSVYLDNISCVNNLDNFSNIGNESHSNITYIIEDIDNKVCNISSLLSKAINNKNVELIHKEKFIKEAEAFEQIYLYKFVEIYGDNYIDNIETYNDLYIYFVLLDRTKEVKELFDKIDFSKEFYTTDDLYYLNYAIERFETVKVWEKLIVHSGKKVSLNKDMKDVCYDILRETILKNEYTKRYGIDYQTDIDEIKSSYSHALCVYKGLELTGKQNTIMNIMGVKNEDLKQYSDIIINKTYERILLSAEEGIFPILPYMYYEYAKSLKESDLQSSFMYANYALSFNNIDYYLQSESIDYRENFWNIYFDELMTSKYFLIMVAVFLFII